MLDPVRARFDAGLRSDPAKFAQDTSAHVPGIVLRCSGIDRARHPGLTRALAEPKSLGRRLRIRQRSKLPEHASLSVIFLSHMSAATDRLEAVCNLGKPCMGRRLAHSQRI